MTIQDNKNASWLDIITSLFLCPADNYGRLLTFRQIFFSVFAIPHNWYYKPDPKSKQWVSGESNDLHTIIKIRKGVPDNEKTILKLTLQCFTVSAAYKIKKKGKEELIHLIPLLQLDFDKVISIAELKKAIFALLFVACVCTSVSGKGLFALILISEPDKLNDYAKHCFEVFKYYGITVDISKGRNYTDLRYVSFDSDIHIREYPEPLQIKRFHVQDKSLLKEKISLDIPDDILLKWAIKEISNATVGSRFETVRRVSFAMGGFGYGLTEIKQAINNSSQFNGIESKYLTHAEEGFAAGSLKPLTAHG